MCAKMPMVDTHSLTRINKTYEKRMSEIGDTHVRRAARRGRDPIRGFPRSSESKTRPCPESRALPASARGPLEVSSSLLRLAGRVVAAVRATAGLGARPERPLPARQPTLVCTVRPATATLASRCRRPLPREGKSPHQRRHEVTRPSPSGRESRAAEGKP